MGYSEWEAGYRNSMYGPGQTVDALLGREHSRANGFGGSRHTTIAREAVESPYTDDTVDNDLAVVMVERPVETAPAPQAPDIHIAPVVGASAVAGEAQIA